VSLEQTADCYCGQHSKLKTEDGRMVCTSCHSVLWQPIDTAPKDGPILIRKIQEVGIAMHNPSIFGGWQLCYSVGFFQEETQANMSNHALPLPTHWMPLPEPPRKGGE